MKKLNFLVLVLGMIIFNACNNQTNRIENDAEPEVVKSPEPVASERQSSGEPWSEEQLLDPAELAQRIKTTEDLPVIFSLGAGNIIPGSKDTGASGEETGLENLRNELEDLPKDTEIVLYCGCCPFNICPNVRPAFNLLNEKGFTNHHLLNLPENIKVDWIDKGYATGS